MSVRPSRHGIAACPIARNGDVYQSDYDVARMSEEQQQPEVSESELIRVRREKLERIAALGFDAYPTTADVDTTIAEVVSAFGDKSGEELESAKASVKIAGRIMGVRAFGKAAFLVL